MPREYYTIIPPREFTQQALERLVSDLNAQLTAISDELARIQGLDGHMPKFFHDLDFAGKRLKNVGYTRDDYDVPNRRELIERAAYRPPGRSEYVFSELIIAEQGIESGEGGGGGPYLTEGDAPGIIGEIVEGMLQFVQVANIDDPSAELASYKGELAGALLIAYTVTAATNDEYTIYAFDESAAAASTPYVVAGSSGSWIAIGGKYTNETHYMNTLTATRLLASDGSKQLVSTTLATWLAGTANEITVTDDGDGTVTLSGAGSDVTTDVLTAIQAGGGGALGIQYKKRSIAFSGGVATVGAESDWIDI